MNVELANVWVAAGVLVGFQVTSFAWRVSREVKVGATDDLTWLPPADIVNLTSMVVAMLGVFVLPILGLVGMNFMEHCFALAVLLFVGYPFALAGHYGMYNNKTGRSYSYFPFQEKVAVMVTTVLVITYLIFAVI